MICTTIWDVWEKYQEWTIIIQYLRIEIGVVSIPKTPLQLTKNNKDHIKNLIKKANWKTDSLPKNPMIKQQKKELRPRI